MTTTTLSRADFADLQGRLSRARAEEAAARREHERAVNEYARASDTASERRAARQVEQAAADLKGAERQTAGIEGEQRGALGQLTTPNGHNGDGPRGDGAWTDGWQQIAATINPASGRFEASVDLGSLIKPPAFGATTITPSSGLTAPAYEVEGIVPLARDVRFLYPLLRSQQVDQGDLAIQEFKQVGSRTVTGSIERDPLATSEKAKLGLSLELVTPSLKQLALYADSVPDKLFYAAQGLGDAAPPLTGGVAASGLLLEWLTSDMKYQLERALDSHVMAQIIAAKPAFSEAGTTLIQRIRNAVSAHRALGANPTILVASPKLAAELDSLEDANKRPVFATRDAGSASPLFGLSVVEITSEEHAPVLIDPNILGINYYSMGTLLVDPFTGGKQNLVNVRLEFDALYHCRDISGAYALSKESLK